MAKWNLNEIIKSSNRFRRAHSFLAGLSVHERCLALMGSPVGAHTLS